jgi:hypothetical protein
MTIDADAQDASPVTLAPSGSVGMALVLRVVSSLRCRSGRAGR